METGEHERGRSCLLRVTRMLLAAVIIVFLAVSAVVVLSIERKTEWRHFRARETYCQGAMDTLAKQMSSLPRVYYERYFYRNEAVRAKPDHAPLTSDDLHFVMMSTYKYHETRVKPALDSWAQQVRHFVTVSDREDASVKAVTWPYFADRDGYRDAGLKSLYGLRDVVLDAIGDGVFAQTRWVVLVDDDTWLNVPHLVEFLAAFDHRFPVMFGYVLDYSAAGAPYEVEPPYVQGGAAIVLSHEAARILGPLVGTEVCPYTNYSDTTLGRCCWRHGVVPVHSSRFHWDGPPVLPWANTGDVKPLMAEVADAISYHYVKPEQQLELTLVAAEAHRTGSFRHKPLPTA